MMGRRPRSDDDGGHGAWLAAVHSRPEVQRIDDVYHDLLRLKAQVVDDPFVRDHFTTLAHRLYTLALEPYKATTPLP